MEYNDVLSIMRGEVEKYLLLKTFPRDFAIDRVSGLQDVFIEVRDGKIQWAKYRHEGGAIVKIKGVEFYL